MYKEVWLNINHVSWIHSICMLSRLHPPLINCKTEVYKVQALNTQVKVQVLA